MVDLTRTEAQMLAAIGTETPDRWRIVGRTPSELLPLLTARLSQQYGSPASRDVSDNLIDLVKKGLGNAYKWGNHRDPGKLLIVASVMTRRGAVVKISDQGNGFDVPSVVCHGCFTHGGSGFARFHRAPSVISYADGGRTLLIQFLCDPGSHARQGSTAAALPAASQSLLIHLHDLKSSDRVKVKCAIEAEGVLRAATVTVKPFEEAAVIEAPLRHVDGRMIRILDLLAEASDSTDIVGADFRPASVDQLRAGQVVELSGRYACGRMSAHRIKIRRAANPNRCELQGAIEELDTVEKRMCILGLVIAIDDHTEIRAGRRDSPSNVPPER
jgi:hypothetical protein